MLYSFAEKNKYPVTHNFIDSKEKLQEIMRFYIEVKHNLLKNRKYIWDKIQQNLAKIINESDQILSLKINEIRILLTWLNIFIEIGEDFSGSLCVEFKNSISKKCVSFFNIFHSSTWNRIVYFLYRNLIEAEQWTRLPIPKDFDIQIEISKNLNSLSILTALTDTFDEINFTFSKLVFGNPFEKDPSNSSEKSDEDQVKVNFGGLKMLENSPVLCTAGLNFIRTAGTYLELMGVLTPISFELFLSLSQFYEFFVKFT